MKAQSKCASGLRIRNSDLSVKICAYLKMHLSGKVLFTRSVMQKGQKNFDILSIVKSQKHNSLWSALLLCGIYHFFEKVFAKSYLNNFARCEVTIAKKSKSINQKWCKCNVWISTSFTFKNIKYWVVQNLNFNLKISYFWI